MHLNMGCLVVKNQDKNKPYFVEYILTEDNKMNEAKNNENK